MKKLLFITTALVLPVALGLGVHAQIGSRYNKPTSSTVTIVKDTPPVTTNNDTQPTVTPTETPTTTDTTPVGPQTPEPSSQQDVVPAAPVVPVTPLPTNAPTVDNPQTLYDQNGNNVGTFHLAN